LIYARKRNYKKYYEDCLVEKYGAEMNKKNVKNELIENGADKDDKLLFYAYILLKYIIKKIWQKI